MNGRQCVYGCPGLCLTKCRAAGECVIETEGRRIVVESLTFADIRSVNVRRSEESFNHRLTDWTIAEWTNAMAGEVGEACNLAKKMIRGDYPDMYALADAQRELGKELADVVLYADLAAAFCGIDLGAAVRAKFNEVSRRRGSDIRL